MLEEILGKNLAFIFSFLPGWATVIIILTGAIMGILHKTGSLERMAKTINIWLRSLIDADKARRDYRKELDLIESGHEAKLETLEVEARLQSQAAYSLESQRFRQSLFEFTREHVQFLQKETAKNNAFFRELIEKGVLRNNVIEASDPKDTE